MALSLPPMKPSSRRLALAALGVLLLLCALVTILVVRRERRAAGPIPQQAYVWQRSWTPAVREAVAQASGFEALVFLGTELDLRREPPGVAWVRFESPAGRPPGIALRAGSFPGRFQDSPLALNAMVEAGRRLVVAAKSTPFELQIDYDCPESKLADYAFLVRELKKRIDVPIVITALPAWLGQKRAFADLIAAADGFVLQVHSLELPSDPRKEAVLCDPKAARRWVETAARFGRPFRVALPTYGYAVAFDAGGKLIGLSAEGPSLAWPAGATVKTVRSDPAAMAELVRGWTRDRPRELAGILWYRLPVPGDRLARSTPARVRSPSPR